MDIDLAKLNYTFTTPPLLIGGKAMEYYGLRKAGADIDFVVTREDYLGLRALYPDRLKEIWGDLGVCPFEFEIWTSIDLFDYNFLSQGAVQEEGYRVISLEKALFLKSLAYKIEKYHKDMELLVEKITKDNYDRLYEPTMLWYKALEVKQGL